MRVNIFTKYNWIFEISILYWGHQYHCNLGQPVQSSLFRQWQSAGAVEAATLESVNGLDCKWIGWEPALQIVANNSHCRAKADGIAQSPTPTPHPPTPPPPHPTLHFHPASEESVWISNMSISYVMNTNMTNRCLTVKLWQSSLAK